MSDDQTTGPRWTRLPGDWWVHVAAFRVLFRQIEPGLVNLTVSHRRTSDAFHYDIFVRFGPPPEIGIPTPWNKVTFTPKDGDSIVTVSAITPEDASKLWGIVGKTAEIAYEARELRREHVSWSADEAIELYYRRRAAGHKTTLRQIAKETKLSYGYLRTAKSEYDKSGKWGSKTIVSGKGDSVQEE